jgi:glycosyltransferase involved in cell wall biosynthesis
MKSEFGQRWVRGCIEAACDVSRRERFDVIVATMSPFATAEAAAAVSQEFGVPWVADLRDPWALDEIEQYPSRWHRRVAVRNMGRCLASAAVVVANTPDATHAMRTELPEVDPARVVTITNGFDPADFAEPPPGRDSKRFRIVHSGHLHTALGHRHRRMRPLRRLLGGERVPTDLLTRSHIILLDALSCWLARDPRVAQEVEVVLAGHASAEDRDAVERSPAVGLVRFAGYLPHDQSVSLLRSADLLFLPMHALPAGERARIVPGKTYEYLAARRPILAAVPEGDARDFVRASGVGSVCDPADAGAMLSILEERFGAFRSGALAPKPDEAFIARFDRAVLTEQLAAVLEHAIAKANP